VVKRALLFAAWAGIGCVGTYALLYVFSAYGLVLMAVTVAVALLLPRHAETLGAIAGPGLFFLLVASYADDPAPWAVAGCALLAVAGYAYAARIRRSQRWDSRAVKGDGL
jgi:heme exporter protein D